MKKIMLIGRTSCGKTTLTQKLMNEEVKNFYWKQEQQKYLQQGLMMKKVQKQLKKGW